MIMFFLLICHKEVSRKLLLSKNASKKIFFNASLLPPSIAAIRLVLFSCMLTQAEKCCTIKT